MQEVQRNLASDEDQGEGRQMPRVLAPKKTPYLENGVECVVGAKGALYLAD